MDNFAPGLKTFDAFPKVSSTYSVRSTRGGVVTVVLVLCSLFLIWVQLAQFLGGIEEQQFSVDNVVSTDMQINIDVTVSMPCEAVTINAQDESQDRLMASELLSFEKADFDSADHHHINKGGQGHESFFKVIKGARKSKFKPKRRVKYGDACRIYGMLPVNRVVGDLHITARGYAYFDRQILPPDQLNFSHVIDEFSFGEYFPKLVNPLDEVVATTPDNMAAYQYFLSVVPTTYISSTTGRVIQTNQYAVTEQAGSMDPKTGQPPGIFFKYDIQPIRLTITDTRMPFTQWLVRLINIIGGLVACTGWMYKFSESAWGRLVGKKLQGTMLDRGLTEEK